MSRELLIELQKECIQLAAGGSELAVGNFKLQKLLPKFERIGQKIKPFKMIYDRINILLNSEKDESEDNLISLTTLVNAILSTQGETDIEGEIEILKGTSMDINTNKANQLIAPIANALTTRGGGRYNIIDEGIKEGVFSDFRLIPLLVKGLDDAYGEIGELIYDKLLEDNNPELLPFLKGSFNRQGKRGDAFKLNLISKILGENTRDFCIDLLEDSSKEVKIEAVNILGDLEETEDFLLKEAKSRVKDIRKAAYCSLVKIKSQEGRKKLEEAIKKTDYDIALEAIKFSDSENYSDILLIGLKNAYAKLNEKETYYKDIQKLIEILREIKNHKSKEVFQFLVQCLEEDKIEQRFFLECISEYENISEKVRDSIEGRKDINKILDLAFKVSLKSRTPEGIYEIYSPYFINKAIDEDIINKTIWVFSEYMGCRMTSYRIGVRRWYRNLSPKDIEGILQSVQKEFDKRWIEIFKQYKMYFMLSYTLNKEDASTIEFMINEMRKYEKVDKGNGGNLRESKDELIDILPGLVKIEYEEAYEVILKHIKAAIEYDFKFHKMLLFIPYLPSKYIEEIEKYILELREKGIPVDTKYIEMKIKEAKAK